jgi:enamine deaminase RidA (YjgF/YER057c/UK114 family)
MAGIGIEPEGCVKPRANTTGMRAPGEVVAIAGQIAWDEKARLVGDGDFVKQFEQALANVVAIVRAAGGTPEDIVTLTIYVLDRADYVARLSEVGAAYRRVMGKHYPTMALLVVAGLLEVGAKVEIQGLAVLP